eukprot:s55_g22.t2
MADSEHCISHILMICQVRPPAFPLLPACRTSPPARPQQPTALLTQGRLGATNDRFQLSVAEELLRHRATASSDDLLLAAWGAPAAAHIFDQLQGEMALRLERPNGPEQGVASFAEDVLGIVSAASAAGFLSAAFSLAAKRWLRSLAVRAARWASPAAARQPPPPTPGEQPQVVLDLPQAACILKPPGWEVYDENADHQLSDFVRRRFGCRIANDLRCRYGFLHRLDVPSSGLILVAKTHESYYDLHFQLAAGQISRSYLLLCHGFVSKGRRVLTASVSWRRQGEARPSAAGGRGRPSFAALQGGAHGVAQVRAVSRLSLRISTGRRHQLRSQLAHVGHPVVRDALYSSQWSFVADDDFCQRNCLHRSGLGFRDMRGRPRHAQAPLPDDFRQSLNQVRLLREWSCEEKRRLGVCTRSTERCLDSFERMLSMQIAKETDILLTIIGLLPLAPMFRRSLDQRRVPESRLQHWQAFLEFASAAARRRAHAKNEGYAGSSQLMLIPSHEIGVNTAKQESTYTVYEAQVNGKMTWQ